MGFRHRQQGSLWHIKLWFATLKQSCEWGNAPGGLDHTRLDALRDARSARRRHSNHPVQALESTIVLHRGFTRPCSHHQLWKHVKGKLREEKELRAAHRLKWLVPCTWAGGALQTAPGLPSAPPASLPTSSAELPTVVAVEALRWWAGVEQQAGCVRGQGGPPAGFPCTTCCAALRPAPAALAARAVPQQSQNQTHRDKRGHLHPLQERGWC